MGILGIHKCVLVWNLRWVMAYLLLARAVGLAHQPTRVACPVFRQMYNIARLSPTTSKAAYVWQITGATISRTCINSSFAEIRKSDAFGFPTNINRNSSFSCLKPSLSKIFLFVVFETTIIYYLIVIEKQQTFGYQVCAKLEHCCSGEEKGVLFSFW